MKALLMLLVRTLLIYLSILALMRLMGKRQLGELQPSELVSTILISNLASVSIESPEIPLAASLAPILLIAALELLLSALCFSRPWAAGLISGRPISVIRDGVIDQEALRELRCGIGDLMAALRSKDIFDPAEVSLALMETSGQLSVCLREDCVSASRKDLKLPPGPAKKPLVPFVMDGCTLTENLLWCGKSEGWLNRTLQAEQVAQSQVLLMLGDDTARYRIIKKEAR